MCISSNGSVCGLLISVGFHLEPGYVWGHCYQGIGGGGGEKGVRVGERVIAEERVSSRLRASELVIMGEKIKATNKEEENVRMDTLGEWKRG